MLDAAAMFTNKLVGKASGMHAKLRRRWRGGVGAALLAFSVLAYSASTVDYTYDSLGRVVKVIYTDGVATTTVTYTYDATGNRIAVATASP